MSTAGNDARATTQRKKAFRGELRSRRRAIDEQRAEAAAAYAAEHLAHDYRWKGARRIGLYLASDGEFATHRLAERARRDGKTLYLPCVDAGSMVMRRWDGDGGLVRNRYGIEEPVGTASPTEHLDILLLPVVGWSATGFRLGMGGGYYDRLLGASDLGAWRVGLAYDCQRDDALDDLRECWDVRLHAILTESRLFTVSD